MICFFRVPVSTNRFSDCWIEESRASLLSVCCCTSWSSCSMLSILWSRKTAASSTSASGYKPMPSADIHAFVLQLALDINDKIEGADICAVVAFFSRLVFLLSEEMSMQICLGIALLQRGQADEAGLIFPFDRDVLSAFYLIIQCP